MVGNFCLGNQFKLIVVRSSWHVVGIGVFFMFHLIPFHGKVVGHPWKNLGDPFGEHDISSKISRRKWMKIMMNRMHNTINVHLWHFLYIFCCIFYNFCYIFYSGERY